MKESISIRPVGDKNNFRKARCSNQQGSYGNLSRKEPVMGGVRGERRQTSYQQ